jgi:hypothetical protein
MNIALWGPSWGGFLDKLNRVGENGATLSDAAREETRRFRRDHVRGRGPLPAIRIADQPYRILPVSAGARWRTARRDVFETELRRLLDRLRVRWRQCVANVPRLGSGPIDNVLLEILGTSPVCVSLRARPVLSSTLSSIGAEAIAVPGDLEIEQLIEGLLWEELHNASLVHLAGSFGESRPLPLPFVHESDPAFIEALIAGSPPAVSSVFQALIELAWDRARRDVDERTAPAGSSPRSPRTRSRFQRRIASACWPWRIARTPRKRRHFFSKQDASPPRWPARGRRTRNFSPWPRCGARLDNSRSSPRTPRRGRNSAFSEFIRG